MLVFFFSSSFFRRVCDRERGVSVWGQGRAGGHTNLPEPPIPVLDGAVVEYGPPARETGQEFLLADFCETGDCGGVLTVQAQDGEDGEVAVAFSVCVSCL